MSAPFNETHVSISHEDAWKQFTKPVPVANVGKISKTAFFDRRPPEDAELCVSTYEKYEGLFLMWWRESDKVWVYITSKW